MHPIFHKHDEPFPPSYHWVCRDMGHSESILCKIRSAKITASAMIECRAGDGRVLSNWQSLRAARIAAMIPITRLRLSSKTQT